MKIAIHQPQYLPWLGYLDKVDSADLFIVLDTVQFRKHEWQNRNRIRVKDGWQWLTVPIIDRFPERIAQVEINPSADWQRKHCQALRLHYAKAQFWEPFGPDLLGLIQRPWKRLAELNTALIEILCSHMGIRTPRVLASSLAAREEPTDRLVDLCRAVGGSTYLAGQGGAEYMDLDRFRASGIRLEVQAYRHPIFPQRYRPFVSHLSVIDLLFNCGPQGLEIIRSGRSWKTVD